MQRTGLESDTEPIDVMKDDGSISSPSGYMAYVHTKAKYTLVPQVV